MIKIVDGLAIVALDRTVPVAAEDWPQWRGADGTGISPETEWKTFTTPPKVLWEAELGYGYAQPTIVDGHLYTAGWRDGKDTLFCFDAVSGEQKWTYSYKEDHYNKLHEGGPGATLAVHDGHAYMVNRSGVVMALDAKTGELKWRRGLAEELSVKKPKWAFTGSAVVYNGKLLVDLGYVLALDPATGKTIWQTAKNYGASYSTPQPFTHKGEKYIAATPRTGLVVLEESTGNAVDFFKFENRQGVNAASPIYSRGGLFISSEYNHGAAFLRFDGGKLKTVYETKEMQNHMCTSVAVGHHIYGFDRGTLKCMETTTGKVEWSQRGLGKGTVLGTGDNRLIVGAADGRLLVIKATPAGFTKMAEFQALDSRGCHVAPTLANGLLYARSPQGQLVCFDVRN